jgi:hypothetical protein
MEPSQRFETQIQRDSTTSRLTESHPLEEAHQKESNHNGQDAVDLGWQQKRIQVRLEILGRRGEWTLGLPDGITLFGGDRLVNWTI